METSEIRVMTMRDAGLALRLFQTAGWGNTPGDFERMLSYEPRGCFAASLGGEDAGMVGTIKYGSVAWIGNLIVDTKHRGRGIGTALMEKAIEYLEGSGASSIRLDGVPGAAPIYRRLGFRDEFRSLRFAGEAWGRDAGGISRMAESDLEDVQSLDERYFGHPRARVLRRVRRDFPGYCFVARSGSDAVGYIMAKDGAENKRVGPWICDPTYPDAAEDLLFRLMAEFPGERTWVGVPEANAAATDILIRNGFEAIPSSIRMCRGDCEAIGDLAGRFGLGGPDKG